MTRVPFPENFGTGTHVSDGDCLDCGKPASVYTVTIKAASNSEEPDKVEVVVVHAGSACPGFERRFTPGEDNPFGPSPSPACDEEGRTFAAPRKAQRRASDGGKGNPPRLPGGDK
jgi:hypothetical protein